MCHEDCHTDLNATFAKIDLNNDGYISIDDIVSFRTKHGKEPNVDRVTKLFNECDCSKDGKLCVKGFTKFANMMAASGGC